MKDGSDVVCGTIIIIYYTDFSIKCSVLDLLRNTKRVTVNGVYSYCDGDGQ